MKTLKTLTFLATFVATLALASSFITSCNTSADKAVKPSIERKANLPRFLKTNAHRLELMALDSTTAQWAAFQELSAEVRYDVWADKLNELNETLDGEDPRRIALNYALENLSESCFSDTAVGEALGASFQEFLTPYVRDSVLRESDLRLMFGNLYSVEIGGIEDPIVGPTNHNGTAPPPNLEDCSCSKRSDFCGWFSKCGGQCSTMAHGCGWFWVMKCTGECQLDASGGGIIF